MTFRVGGKGTPPNRLCRLVVGGREGAQRLSEPPGNAQRRSAGLNSARLEELGVLDDIELVDVEMLEDSNIRSVLKKLKPDEIYNLAAQSFVALSSSSRSIPPRSIRSACCACSRR